MSGSGREHVLLTEDTFHASYLVGRWRDEFPDSAGLIVIRSAPPTDQVRAERLAFGQQHAGRRRLSDAEHAVLGRLYPDYGSADRAMVELFGVPAPASASGLETVHLGERLNDEPARRWFDDRLAGRAEVFLSVFLDRILAPWWITGVAGRIVNAHSAILPIARGSNAIEQIAAQQDRPRFARAAGATLHYVDTGVDTGAVVEARPLPDPFGFDSIWQCKAASFGTAFDLLVETARRLPAGAELPSGEPQHADELWPDFRRADFDAACRRRAELGYAWWRHHAGERDGLPDRAVASPVIA